LGLVTTYSNFGLFLEGSKGVVFSATHYPTV